MNIERWAMGMVLGMLSLPTFADSGGYSTATGSNDPVRTVSNLAQLKAAFASSAHHIVIAGTLYGGPTLTTLTFSSKTWDNTTIEGAPGGAATLVNIQLKFDGERLPVGQSINNIVVKNITFHGNIADLQALPTQASGTPENAGVNYEGVSLRQTTNAWIDHCTFFDTSDDLISVTRASDNVTISYSRFYFTASWLKMNPDPSWSWVGKYQDLANERLSMVIGSNPSDSFMTGPHALHVTLHHNWIGPLIKGRPLLRGYVHVYNNYFDNTSTPVGAKVAAMKTKQYNALQIGSGGFVISESNYFSTTNQSNQVGLDAPSDPYAFHERNNIYDATTGVSATGTPFSDSLVSYAYTPDAASDVPGLVQANAGPK